jgi:TolA-binding protein
MLSKAVNLVVLLLLPVFIGIMAYRHTNLFNPGHAEAKPSASVTQTVPEGPFGKGSSDDLLNQARDAFAKGDIQTAVTTYKDYIKKNPSNSDASGELGNVYFSVGSLPEAAQSYYDAADLLIGQKQLDRVNEMIPVIGQINPALANELSAKMAKAGQP